MTQLSLHLPADALSLPSLRRVSSGLHRVREGSELAGRLASSRSDAQRRAVLARHLDRS